MHRVIASTLATAFVVLSFTSAGAQEGDTCATARCPDAGVIDLARARIAQTCDCAAASNAKEHMRCVRRVIGEALDDGSLPRACRSSVTRCEAVLGCGQGIRPFRAVQTVFKQSCALSSCHSALSRQGGLVLESEEVSYANLVGQPATLPEAHAAGMLRVAPGDPRDSLLIRKLRGEGPGDAMPQGTSPLPRSTIKIIEKWIKRGAKTTAEECPPAASSRVGRRQRGKVCNDRPIRSGNFVWQPQPALEAPAPGTGIQLFAPRRDVVAGTEWETCLAIRPNWTALAAEAGYTNGLPVIKEQTYRMHDGSHHLLLYMYYGQHPEDWPEGYFPCSAANCLEPGCPSDAGLFTLPIGGTQVAGTRYEVRYPAGVGIPVLGPNAVLIVNLHFTNPFQPPQPIYGEAWLNLLFYRQNEFKALLDGIFAVNWWDLYVRPFESKTFSAVWQPRGILGGEPADAAIFQLFGHMHKRGATFQIDYVKGGQCSVPTTPARACARDDDCRCTPRMRNCVEGQTCIRGPAVEDTPIYFADQWDHAPVVDFPEPYFLVNRNEGLRWTCTHVNGVPGDPNRPPKVCHEHCNSCGWDGATRTCDFRRGVGLDRRIYAEGEPIPLVFGELADDDMCNMFGYFINQEFLPLLP